VKKKSFKYFFIRLLCRLIFCGVILIPVIPGYIFGQETEKEDSTFVEIDYGKTETTLTESDTITQYQDVYPLDIAGDRGLFILSPDRMMQMRILGSVRTLMNYGDQAMPQKLTFNPYEIPMFDRPETPNFYADLSLTRLGFEVTRRTRKMGDLFIRIETDFSGNNGFRIRHAYGQLGRLLIGQTWTLFSNGNFVPATVSRDGAAGSSVFFTPQIRYSRQINNTMSWQVSIEYSKAEIVIPDSINAELVQVIPDVIARLNYSKDRLSCRLTGLITTVSGTDTSNIVSYAFGGGASFAGIYNLSSRDDLHFSLTSTYSSSRFLDMFSGKNVDVAYNPSTQKFDGLIAWAGFLAWSRKWPKNISSSISGGFGAITNRAFQWDIDYSHGYNALFNLFWQPVDGARLGLEYASGERWNISGARGRATRLSILMYYDF